MENKKYISLFIILQMLIGFGLATVVALNILLGPLAVLIYSITSFAILSVFGLLLWYRNSEPEKDKSKELKSINALGFGIIFAFIMAEIVAVIIVTKL